MSVSQVYLGHGRFRTDTPPVKTYDYYPSHTQGSVLHLFQNRTLGVGGGNSHRFSRAGFTRPVIKPTVSKH